MATTTTLTRGELIEETLNNLYRHTERPRFTRVGVDALSNAADTQLNVESPDEVSRSSLLEAGSEMMLVTSKSTDAVPLFTVVRAYAGTSAIGGHPTNTPLLIDPLWARADLQRWIETFFRTTMNAFLPHITSQVVQRVPANQYVIMPADTVRVLSLRHFSSLTGRVIDLASWQFEEDLPTSVVWTGKLLRLSAAIYDDDELIVTYQAPYTFTGTGDAATIEVPLGSEDLAPLWAAAYGLARREVSRAELDKVEEWNKDQAYRQGVSLRLVQQTWGEFYRRLDEARKIQNVPRHRPYRKTARTL